MSYGPHHYSFDSDPPMHGIRFIAAPQDDSQRTLNLRGTGEDGIRSFHLDGNLVPETAQIRLKKRYAGGYSERSWACMMTPMGIVCSWGPNNYDGWIWLWKVGGTEHDHPV